MKHSSSSSMDNDDEDDDIPLKFLSHSKSITKETEQPVHISNGYTDDLLKFRLLECDFCDIKLFNRYQYFVHNASHIIIPLIKLKVHECPQCCHHFPGTEQLNQHQIEKHYRPLKSNCLILGKNENKKIIESIVEKEPLVQLQAMAPNLNEKPIIIDLDSDDSDSEGKKPKTNGYLDSTERNNLEMLVENALNKQLNENRNRFIFEEDLLLDTPTETKTNEIKIDLTNDCKVKLNVYDVPWWKNVVKPTSEDDVTDSIHYDDLMRPGFYKCKRCRKSFPNRYYLIKHETSHMKIRRRCPNVCVICEKIVGCRKKLKRHYKEVHPGQKPIKTFLKCLECGLQYSNYEKHIATYHNVYKCQICDQDFLTRIEKDSHASRHLDNGKFACHYCEMEGTVQEINCHTRLVHSYVHCGHIYLCEVCLDFLKNRGSFRYNIIGPYNEIGVRRHCDKCGKKCFELMIVDRQRRVGDRKLVMDSYNKKQVGKHKGLSNEDRLKHIKRRLKKLKQCFCCFISD